LIYINNTCFFQLVASVKISHSKQMTRIMNISAVKNRTEKALCFRLFRSAENQFGWGFF
jgi:hypothetical protein